MLSELPLAPPPPGQAWHNVCSCCVAATARKEENAMLTRRKLLKSGLVVTGAALLVSRGRWAYADDVKLPSRRLEPFVDPLPLPVDHQPVQQLHPPLDPPE